MQPSTPTTLYQQALDAGDYQSDNVQQRAVAQLDQIYHALKQRQSEPPAGAGLRGRLNRLIGRAAPKTAIPPVQGLYMWGSWAR